MLSHTIFCGSPVTKDELHSLVLPRFRQRVLENEAETNALIACNNDSSRDHHDFLVKDTVVSNDYFDYKIYLCGKHKWTDVFGHEHMLMLYSECCDVLFVNSKCKCGQCTLVEDSILNNYVFALYSGVYGDDDK